MNILVISQYYYPEQFRINDICEELVKKGNMVTVLSGIPNYPLGEIYDGYENSHKNLEVKNGVRIIRCNNRPRHRGIINLILNYLSYVRCSNKIIKNMREKFDIVYVYELSPITMAIPAIIYKKKTGTPLYLYCLDLWPESIREISNDRLLSTHNPIYLITKIVSQKIYNSADCVGIKCREFSDYLINVCKVNPNKIKLLYEHAEDSYLQIGEKTSNEKCYNFMFLGNIGIAQNCEILLKAVSALETKINFKLHFVGDGSDLENLKNKTKEFKLEDKVVFHGRQPVSEVNKYYAMADCCLLTLSNNTACGLTLPAKLTGYMASGRPIIAAADGATKSIIGEADCGICISPKDVDGIRVAMQYALENQVEFRNKGLNGREYFKTHFTLEDHIKNLLEQFEELREESV